MDPKSIQLYRKLAGEYEELFSRDERKELRRVITGYFAENKYDKNTTEEFISRKLEVTSIILNEIGLDKAAVISYLLIEPIENHFSDEEIEMIEKKFDVTIFSIAKGLRRIKVFNEKSSVLENENFRKMLLSLAEDIRVMLIILAVRLQAMRNLEKYTAGEQEKIIRESSFLYTPLAHRMGLYTIKTELEDLSLKHTDRDTYKSIAEKLNETKRAREQYIAEFIKPLQEKIKETEQPFEIKGRTKSIYSIYSKIKKQNTTFENIYDLFAIRIIFDTPVEKEKAVCWQAYSIVADMYQPNPIRLRDWLSIPKSNGYESLHTTVLGPQNKWVEVQIRTRRMDQVAEKGLAAHWKYKGIKSESGIDDWLKNIREVLENPGLNNASFMDEFKLSLYEKEVFVFSPEGDLHKLPKGATALDFAFSVHSNLGTQCVGAKVNGKHVQIKYVLNSGDQVEVLTSPTQKPNPAWLNIVVTSKAKSKIRQTLNELKFKDAEIGRETLLRRFKNWKIELDDSAFSRLAKKKGYKTVSDLYQDVAHEKIDIHELKAIYLELENRENNQTTEIRTAESFIQEIAPIPEDVTKEDVLVIDNNIKNIDYKLAKCCNPIYGDDIFGFVSVAGGIKIHRTNCPNAPQMMSKFGYRIISARWSGKSAGSLYPITLRVIGRDDIGIVTNITSVISKEKDVLLRSISINSNVGLFQGNITVMINDNKNLDNIIKKIKTVKGVKTVSRI